MQAYIDISICLHREREVDYGEETKQLQAFLLLTRLLYAKIEAPPLIHTLLRNQGQKVIDKGEKVLYMFPSPQITGGKFKERLSYSGWLKP